MKPSQKSLLAVLGATALIIVFANISLRIAVTEAASKIEYGEYKAPDLENLHDFDEVNISGVWELELVQADEWMVQADIDELKNAQIEIYVENNTLILRQRSFLKFWQQNHEQPHVRVEMPQLERVSVSGGSEVTMDGFKGEQLDVNVSGAAEMEGKESQYTYFNIDASGAVEIDFREVEVTHANVDLSGAGEISLTMNGGNLTGQVSGAAEIDYYGSVAKEDIQVSGAAEINHKK